MAPVFRFNNLMFRYYDEEAGICVGSGEITR